MDEEYLAGLLQPGFIECKDNRGRRICLSISQIVWFQAGTRGTEIKIDNVVYHIDENLEEFKVRLRKYTANIVELP